jgi:hypothetical protein
MDRIGSEPAPVPGVFGTCHPVLLLLAATAVATTFFMVIVSM